MLKKLLREEEKNVSRTKKALALSIASMVTKLLTLLLSMVSARVLTKTEIAVNSQTFLVNSTATPFLTMGITSGLYYYLTQNEHRKRAAVNECVVPVVITSGLFSLFLLLGGNSIIADLFHNPSLAETLYLMVPYTVLHTVGSVVKLVFVQENRLRFNAAYNVIHTLTTLLVAMAAVLLFRTGMSLITSRVAVSCVFSLLTIYLVYSILPRDSQGFSWKNIRILLGISIPLGLSSLVGTLSHDLDKWIISTMQSPEVYAIYTQGAREVPLISTITGAISTVLVVDLTKAAKEKRYHDAAALFSQTAYKSSLFLMPVMVFCLVAAEPLITFLYTDAYLNAVSVFRIYLLYMPSRVVFYGPFLIALGKSKTVLRNTIGCLLSNAVLSVIFVTLFGAEGAAIATVLATMLFLAPANLLSISHATGISWKQLLPFGHIFKCILLSVPGALCCMIAGFYLVPELHAFWTLAVEGCLFCAVTLPLMCWQFKISPKAIFSRIFARFKR